MIANETTLLQRPNDIEFNNYQSPTAFNHEQNPYPQSISFRKCAIVSKYIICLLIRLQLPITIKGLNCFCLNLQIIFSICRHCVYFFHIQRFPNRRMDFSIYKIFITHIEGQVGSADKNIDLVRARFCIYKSCNLVNLQ